MTNARTVFIAALLGAVLLAAAPVRADEIQDAVQKLVSTQEQLLVQVHFDLHRADGTGGREIKLQGTLVGDRLVLVSGAKQVDPPVGGREEKPKEFNVVFPGDDKHKAVFVGKDEELNLAVLKIGGELTLPGEALAVLKIGGELTPAGEALAGAKFPKESALTIGQPLIALKRLGKGDNDVLTYSILRVAAVIPRPGLPTEYQMLRGMNGLDGCVVYSLDGKRVGVVAGATRVRGRGGFRIVGGRLQRMPAGGGSGHPIRLLDAETVGTFLADPTRFARRDCWLGAAGLQALTKELAEALGVEKPGGLVIGRISERSPAERAGLEAEDVLLALDGEDIDTKKDRDIASFVRKIRRAQSGSDHTFSVLRKGTEGFRKLDVKVTLEEAPLTENEIVEYHDKTFGLKLKPLTRDFLERSHLPLDAKGVRVTWIEPASWAFLAGIRPGDVIQKMVLQKCPDLDTYKEIMAELMTTRDSEVCYNVVRSRKSVFLCVRPDWETVEKK